MRFLRCYVFSVFFLCVESRTLSEATNKRLEAFEMWLYGRMFRMSCTDRITNENILQRMNKEEEILATIETQKLQ